MFILIFIISESKLGINEKHSGGVARKWKWKNGNLINFKDGGVLGHDRIVRSNKPGQWMLDYNGNIMILSSPTLNFFF